MTRCRLSCLVSAGLVSLCLAFVAKASLDRMPMPSWGNPSGDGVPIMFEGEMQVGQAFVAPLPGLARIEVALTPGTTASAAPLVFRLRSDPAATEDLWTATVDGRDLGAGGLYGFEFPLQPDSQGRTYYFSIESPTAVTAPNDLAIGYDPNIVLDDAGAYINGKPAKGNLQFRTLYSLRTRDRVLLLLDRMAGGRPYFLGSPGFYVLLALAYCLILVLFLLRAAGAFLGREEQNT